MRLRCSEQRHFEQVSVLIIHIVHHLVSYFRKKAKAGIQNVDQKFNEMNTSVISKRQGGKLQLGLFCLSRDFCYMSLQHSP